MLECVVNVSEGRRREVLVRIAEAGAPYVLDLHTDPDHHRSVFTLAAEEAEATQDAARRLTRAAVERVSLAEHEGVHPRLGVVDVVPFVALGTTPAAVAVDAAQDFAGWIGAELEVPAFLYDAADPQHRTLPSVRRDAFAVRPPDAGPDVPHPELGATAVGARPPLIAVNVELDHGGLALARAVAHHLRERDGGLPGVRALGFELPSRATAQVSMNLVDLDATGIEDACVEARRAIEAGGGAVRRVELVGLLPESAYDATSTNFRRWSRLDREQTIEARLARVSGPSGG